MSTWLNVKPVRFLRRAIQVEVRLYQHAEIWQELIEMLRRENTPPDILETWFREKLVQHWPGWQGAVLISMHLDMGYQSFVFTIEHPSLPVVPDGERLPREALIVEEVKTEVENDT
jgi:hypothetical protein